MNLNNGQCDCLNDCGDDPRVKDGSAPKCQYWDQYNLTKEQRVENQHRQIIGYRDLSAEEITLMNKIKTKGAEVGELVNELKNLRVNSALDQRWVAIGTTHLQEGFMALTRAVAKPEFF